jgi:hypothetical protein
MITDELAEYYNLYNKVNAIQGCMCILRKLLQPKGLITTALPGKLANTTSNLVVALAFDDFLVRYTCKEHEGRLLLEYN